MKNKLISGFLWGIGFSLAAALILNGMVFVESLFHEDRIEIAHKIEKFQVLNSSNRIVTRDSGSSHLVISGEVSSLEFEKLSSIKISAEVRNSDGGFVDQCFNDLALPEGAVKVSFKITCMDISSSEQFSSYEFSIQGLYGKFI
ncbi:hypothetical protein [Shewanella halotolerans]|uniref:hypothetical protein n=1 Tax=Shewanella halotolerans TaxID=2864204 RepID=UPI001C65F966|nr:hypothetical protein [Shewanella halotolerans]QYJ89341.1 hypothetical protein K0H81_16425 [Shewanella halotolerans]